MRKLLTYGIISVLTLFYVSCDSNKGKDTKVARNCIDRVLLADSQLGKKRNHECEQISLTQTIDNYVKGLREVDFGNCPLEFERAFEKHIAAWVEMTKVTDRYSGLRGEMHDLFDQIKQTKDSVQFDKSLKEIWRSWEVIEKSKNR
ncbi:hypothetical protein MQE36_06610 [Zhouia spongiae]|uniref:Lipoprotein n=1 Tax=Zhouia spongiae TaxID=2202721 RepID=A0ABY3YR59_9FLAO|nr:hypothetical protein [Zhouia spongiae]UNZ00015.1 hypothetical protein MQE36_06610 [Zhouia spongiae]